MIILRSSKSSQVRIAMRYIPSEIEPKWRQYWIDNDTYKTIESSDKPKFYVLDMFPYPSGAGLHVGHPLGYVASDIYARFMRLQGYNVLHPMGYDSFGLPAEEYAQKMGVHPAASTDKNIIQYRAQLDKLGLSFDWSRQVKTSDPSYYKWTQKLFIDFFEHYYDVKEDKAMPLSNLIEYFDQNGSLDHSAFCSDFEDFTASEWKSMSKKEQADILMCCRLAFRQYRTVNWCEALGTVLSNDEVKDGVSERGGHPVRQMKMEQWMLRITAYAERLLQGLEEVDFSSSLKAIQRNWIGKSEGANIRFAVENHSDEIEVFTTRPDTIYGTTFMVIAPEHPLVESITSNEQKAAIEEYKNYVATRSERDRIADVDSVTGAFTGAYCINPISRERLPIWISEYVLAGYGTGAIMAVPGGDARDLKFAKHFDLPIVQVVDQSDHPDADMGDKVGLMINSKELDGLKVKAAIKKAIYLLQESGAGKKTTSYRLHDASIARQRYWGEPIPIWYDDENIAHAVPFEELPLELPEIDDFNPKFSMKSPVANNQEWVHPSPGVRRETDTMPGNAGSSWYFLRYMDPNNPDGIASQDAINYWQDVDLYVGGAEHATGHLLYARMWHMFLYDKGIVPTQEPFKRLVNQGMIQGVIEYMYLLKDKTEGRSHFICTKHCEAKGISKEDISAIPVPVSFMEAYGTDESYISVNGFKQFIAWMPSYKDSIFECGKGIFDAKTEVFTPHDDATDAYLITRSEIGKMSKRYHNVINPDDVVAEYGSDAFRMYEMFIGPIEQAKPWNTNGIEGVLRCLRRIWGLFYDNNEQLILNDSKPSKDDMKALHTLIRDVKKGIETFSHNTCVSDIMIATNALRTQKCSSREVLEPLTVVLSPFAPHLAEELWQILGHNTSVTQASFPEFDESWLKEDSVTYPVSINGKRRAEIQYPIDKPKAEIEAEILSFDSIQKYIEGKEIKRIIVVPKRMINIVVA